MHVSEMGSRMGQFTKAVARYLWQVLLNVHEATNRWRDDDAGLLAAGVAFFATISMVPLLLVLIAGDTVAVPPATPVIVTEVPALKFVPLVTCKVLPLSPLTNGLAALVIVVVVTDTISV